MEGDKEFLQHFGIPGMRWGRRKSSGGTVHVSSKDHIDKETLKQKPLHAMTNEELRTFTTRVNLEKQYKELTKKPVHPIKKFVKELISNAGKQAAKQVVDAQSKKLVEELLKNGAKKAVNETAKKTAQKHAAKVLSKGLSVR